MDAKAEAEKRSEAWTRHLASKRNHRQARRSSFDEGWASGAAWALREFGDMLDDADPAVVGSEVALALAGWGCDAHHIADGIEEGS